GAMCMAYSGRCLLSTVLTGRSANRGDCAQPCRWSYAVMEETRPGEYFPVEEDQRGSYLFNSRDLCLLEYLPSLRAAGVSSVKIEGRMKSSYYVAVVTRVYRRMIDLLACEDGDVSTETMATLKKELTRVSHRGYTHGFIDGDPGAELQNVSDSSYIRNYQYVALVLEEHLGEKSSAAPILLAVKDQISVGDKLLVMDPSDSDFAVTIIVILGDEGKSLVCAHPGRRVWVDVDHGALRPGQILHREIC
ncbi:MAG: U32 family peptidase C-terminal domain-containing protein, partial [Deltaproteobacteria bacterium]|nr:U32 family peptidase C-terminal domain-containing protein [Deltaproteobacteria bacterium]